MSQLMGIFSLTFGVVFNWISAVTGDMTNLIGYGQNALTLSFSFVIYGKINQDKFCKFSTDFLFQVQNKS